MDLKELIVYLNLSIYVFDIQYPKYSHHFVNQVAGLYFIENYFDSIIALYNFSKLNFLQLFCPNLITMDSIIILNSSYLPKYFPAFVFY